MVKKAFVLVADGSEEIEFVTVYDGMTGFVSLCFYSCFVPTTTGEVGRG